MSTSGRASPLSGLAARLQAPAYLSLYVLLSGGQIFFNKWVLSASYFNFPFPVTLTTTHMIFSSLLCALLVHVFKVVKLQPGMTTELYFKGVLPIGAMFAMTLWFGNTAYLYISVAFAQMLKAVMPAAVFLAGVGVGLEQPSWRMFAVMCVISGGVLVASVGEVKFNALGVTYQLLGVVGEAGRLILIELLLKTRGVKLDPMSMMYYVSPCSAACLLPPFIFLELPRLYPLLFSPASSPSLPHFDPIILSLNALCTFALNVSVFLVIQHTSALTVRVAGVVKDWLVVLVSALLFRDATLSPLNILGYAIAIAGVGWYHRRRSLEVKAASSSSTTSSSSLPSSKGDSMDLKGRGKESPEVTPAHPTNPISDEEAPLLATSSRHTTRNRDVG